MAYDFGIIRGSTPTTFNPTGSATREVAATMMIRLYESFYSKINWTHAFYAISSYSQKDMLPAFGAVSFGWSRLETDAAGAPVLNTTASGGNAYGIPTGYQEVVQLSRNSSVKANLSVFMSASHNVTLPDGTVTDACSVILNNPDNRIKAVSQIIAELQRENNYSGVTIDFEELRGAQLKSNFSLFLQELRVETSLLGLTIYVCVPPVTSDGIYYDGYDYRAIGDCADKVILMAHDYAAKKLSASEMNAGFTSTPVSPIYEIYTALKAITDPATGVTDTSRIALAVSFNSVQWKLSDGKVVNAAAFQPEPPSIYGRLLDPAAVLNYSVKYQNPYITYHNSTDNTDNIGWYEDTRSIEAKMDLARMFGITGISFWRLGLIPAYADTPDRQVFYDIPSWLTEQK
jgi:spore germination protein YaaH